MAGKATTTLVFAVLLVSLAGPGSSAARAQAPTNEALVSFVGPTKLKVRTLLAFSVTCAAACNVEILGVLLGPPAKEFGFIPSRSLMPGVPFRFTEKPGGPALDGLKASPGRYKLNATVEATNPATGEVDTDKRTFTFK